MQYIWENEVSGFKGTFRIFEDFVNLDCQLQYLIMDKASFARPLPICRFQFIS